MTATSQLFDDPEDNYVLPKALQQVEDGPYTDTEPEPVQTQELDFDQANYWGMGASDDE